MSGAPVVSRTLTIVAIAFLTFDGAALAALGVMTGRPLLVPVGLVFFVSAGVILLYWRWYRRKWKEIADERQGVRDEVREMQRMLRSQK
jgi:uncharacterized membrane protein